MTTFLLSFLYSSPNFDSYHSWCALALGAVLKNVKIAKHRPAVPGVIASAKPVHSIISPQKLAPVTYLNRPPSLKRRERETERDSARKKIKKGELASLLLFAFMLVLSRSQFSSQVLRSTYTVSCTLSHRVF